MKLFITGSVKYKLKIFMSQFIIDTESINCVN